MTELIFQKELILIKETNQKSVVYAIIGVFYIKTLAMIHVFAMDVMI